VVTLRTSIDDLYRAQRYNQRRNGRLWASEPAWVIYNSSDGWMRGVSGSSHAVLVHTMRVPELVPRNRHLIRLLKKYAEIS
jgi:hypothetical protein